MPKTKYSILETSAILNESAKSTLISIKNSERCIAESLSANIFVEVRDLRMAVDMGQGETLKIAKPDVDRLRLEQA